MVAPVPIFILFKDRVSVLVETIRSLHRHIRTPFEIVVINDKTTFPAAKMFLDKAEKEGVKVINTTLEWQHFDHLYNHVADIVEKYNYFRNMNLKYQQKVLIV
ncbi:hypothetical protein HDV03_005504 [Kappamyces sp. JEL0829]|nr:hypothetical protein HDV03_005504 [Kappamyces sp. JEL0829]